MSRGITTAITILILAVVVSGCDSDDPAVATEPSAFRNELNMVIVPSVLGRAGCPSVSPFPVPFVLNVTAGTQPLLLSEVRMQSTHTSGRTSPPAVFDSVALTRRFGSVRIERRATRQFQFNYDFRCDATGDVGLLVWATTTDGTGLERVSQLRVPVH